MITKTITTAATAADQYSAPLLVGPEERAVFELTEATATLVCTAQLQVILVNPGGDPARPNDASTSWVTYEKIDVFSTPVTKVSEIGRAWFRVLVEAGDMISGDLGVKISTTKA